MSFKTLLPGFIALTYALRATARPQVTTALPFGVVDGSGGLANTAGSEIASGVIVGSGADGTTYVLSVAPTATDDTGFTVTLVENASSGNAVVVISDAGIIATESVGCAFNDGSAVCTQQIVQASDTFTFTEAITTSGSADVLTVVVSTSSAGAASTATGTASGSTATQSSGARKMAVIGLSCLFSVVLSLILA